MLTFTRLLFVPPFHIMPMGLTRNTFPNQSTVIISAPALQPIKSRGLQLLNSASVTIRAGQLSHMCNIPLRTASVNKAWRQFYQSQEKRNEAETKEKIKLRVGNGSFFLKYTFILGGWSCVPMGAHGGQRSTIQSWVCPSTMRILDIQFRFSSLAP